MKHDRWYCRAKSPGADSYKVVSLRTSDLAEAKGLAEAELEKVVNASPPGRKKKQPFFVDTQELKPGLVIFRRGDGQHRRWYCRIRLRGADRYKIVSLRTGDYETAKERAYDEDAEVRFKVKHEAPVFDRTFVQVAKAFADLQLERVEAGQISRLLWLVVDSAIRAALDLEVGALQITSLSQDHWSG